MEFYYLIIITDEYFNTVYTVNGAGRISMTDEIKEWAKENIENWSYKDVIKDGEIYIMFSTEADAVAFKLRWL